MGTTMARNGPKRAPRQLIRPLQSCLDPRRMLLRGSGSITQLETSPSLEKCPIGDEGNCVAPMHSGRRPHRVRLWASDLILVVRVAVVVGSPEISAKILATTLGPMERAAPACLTQKVREPGRADRRLASLKKAVQQRHPERAEALESRERPKLRRAAQERCQR